ncbi:Guanosine 5'-monophosphoramidase [Granulibacter bethesdensis]|uniref:Guanosine 5'-monophosphoramidase n=1 Tax=Granulibacter bethesdensis TaxID=364410 RepID=A0AAC9KFV6_9PROT|nr:histidine triad nucleotide-binding protein [Granulibacter bethesdensis]APH55553.1 Guanosine 5'-monophosphoramidase [Granulibacter bethesdensis]APH63139.1 Guanosine 5'-monophosphoramidase [Granulibacter bethesdensis]
MPVSAIGAYDPDNIFALILRGEIPCRKVMENDHALAFLDINPQAPTHVLIIPKKPYISFADFTERASAEEVGTFFLTVGKLARDMGLEVPGYRLLANSGQDAGQEVPHFHVHLFAGRPLGPMLLKIED